MANNQIWQTQARQPWQQALRESGVMLLLTDFDPHVAGTLPIGVSIESSDIDI